MDQKFTACTGPGLEEVQQRFERWWEGRKRGKLITAALWEPGQHQTDDQQDLSKPGKILDQRFPS